jgi:hypothetical protein
MGTREADRHLIGSSDRKLNQSAGENTGTGSSKGSVTAVCLSVCRMFEELLAVKVLVEAGPDFIRHPWWYLRGIPPSNGRVSVHQLAVQGK